MPRRLAGACVAVALAGALLAAGLRRPEPPPATEPPLRWGEPGREAPGTFDKPRCVSVAPDGTLYVLDLTGRIQHFTPGGEYLDSLRMPDVSLGRPQGIDVGPDGDIYVADTHYNRIVRFAPDGTIRTMWAEAGREPGELFWPCAIVVSPDGTVYTAEYGGHDRIQVWTGGGERLRGWGRFGTAPGDFQRPAGLALDAEGRVYVADAANHRIQVFSPEGSLLRILDGGNAVPLLYPYDVGLDAAGRIYTVEYGGERVRAFSAQGEVLGAWGAEAGLPQPLRLRNPWGLDAAPDGTIFVTDTDNGRILRLEPGTVSGRHVARAPGRRGDS